MAEAEFKPTMTYNEADRMIHAYRVSRAEWAQILMDSNYSHLEALQDIALITAKIEFLKGWFRMLGPEPSLEQVAEREARWYSYDNDPRWKD